MAIEIFRYNNKWRIKIVNETLEFTNIKDFENELIKLTKLKVRFEPYDNKEDKDKRDGKKREE